MSRPAAPAVAPLIREHYARPDHEAGGCMHVQLDDLNLENAFFSDGSRERCEACSPACVALFDLLRMMKQTARRKAVDLAHYPR